MNKNLRLFILILVAVACTFFFANTTSENFNHPLKVVETKHGKISGIISDDQALAIFKGIPFAKPPVGELRWKAPQEMESWGGIKKCYDYGPSPMQEDPTPFMVYTEEFLIPKEKISEDCLYLNVWTGARSKDENRPVFVWIYGGGFTSGGSAVPIYDGEALARKGVVFVSINYRVGIFGFLAHPGLSKESKSNSSGNYGLLDQMAALRWVKENIEAFGGDPNNITIAGQSAGSMSVNCQVASLLSKGLFHKAIGESGSNLLPGGFISEELSSAEKRGEELMKSLGVKSIDEMREISAEEILEKSKGRFVPIIDGYFLLKPIPQVFKKGTYQDVPLITGWNADDAFISSFKNSEEFKKEAREKYGNEAEEFLSYYPANTDEEAMRSQISLNRDMLFGMTNYQWAKLQSKSGKSPVYVYFFERKPPATGEFVKYGSFHTAEVPYALGNLNYVNRPWEQVDRDLSELMSDFWVNFAKTGDPNSKGLPEWPEYDSGENKVMIFDEKSHAEYFEGKAALEFLLKNM